MPVSLHAQILGDGPPLVVLHGLFGSGTNWRSFARSLSDRWQIHLVDLRNHGQSAHADRMTYPEMAADLAAYLDGQDIQSATLLGHSMGGKVAMRLTLESPARVKRLVVVDIAPLHSDHDHLPVLNAMQALDPGTIERRDQAAEALEKGIPDPGLRQFLLQNLVAADGGYRWRINLDAIRRNLDALQDFPLDDLGGDYQGPALFVRGQLSDYVPDSALTRVRELFPGTDIVTIENAGHWVHAERPAAFLEAVEPFLSADPA